jgi:hypothetical protein
VPSSNHSPIRGRTVVPRNAAGYEPARKPKLRAPVVTVPPPVPAPSAAPSRGFTFGDAEEDALRMLAALETMDSLEPDFCGDDVTEASVTIIERANVEAQPAEEAVEPPAGSLRARLDDLGDAPDINPDEYAAYLADVEEAIVEIVEVAPLPQPVASSGMGPSELPARPKRAHRYLKALTGGDGD